MIFFFKDDIGVRKKFRLVIGSFLQLLKLGSVRQKVGSGASLVFTNRILIVDYSAIYKRTG